VEGHRRLTEKWNERQQNLVDSFFDERVISVCRIFKFVKTVVAYSDV
jgi:hypothetical protein